MSRKRLIFAPDPGWLFLVGGIVLIGATVLIPAHEDLRRAHHERDVALAVETHRLERLERYGAYLDALRREDPVVVRSLAATQLNLIPIGMATVASPEASASRPASVFPALEPPAPDLPEHRPIDSTLASWTAGNATRLWLLAGGVMCLLIGLLPPVGRD